MNQECQGRVRKLGDIRYTRGTQSLCQHTWEWFCLMSARVFRGDFSGTEGKLKSSK